MVVDRPILIPGVSDPPTVFTVCGPPASGKTTLARRIAEERRGVCFSADEWILELYAGEVSVLDQAPQRERVWRQIWRVAERLLELGVDVVLDFSFYTSAERDRFRRLAHEAGAGFRMFHLDVAPHLLRQRLERRNLALPDHTFAITPTEFDVLLATFETPGPEEAEVVHVHGDLELP